MAHAVGSHDHHTHAAPSPGPVVYNPNATLDIQLLQSVQYATCLTLVPCLCMALGSLLVLVKSPPQKLVYALQHFGAGIVLSAVALELVPMMRKEPTNAWSIASIVIGFSIGVLLMLCVRKFCEGDSGHGGPDGGGTPPIAEGDEGEEGGDGGDDDRKEEEEERKALDDAEAGKKRAAGTAAAGASGRYEALSRDDDGGDGGEGESRIRTRSLGSYNRRARQDLAAAAPPTRSLPAPAFPVALGLAVTVDALMDGLLVGISSVESTSAGVTMAVALAIEMTFLGLSYAVSLKPQPRRRALFALLLAPATLLFGGVMGAVLTAALQDHPVVKVGLVSFGVAALLYLVAEELLLEAHEDDEDHVWWIDLQFFVGFLASFIVEKLTALG
eukprot:g4005.t1